MLALELSESLRHVIDNNSYHMHGQHCIIYEAVAQLNFIGKEK